MPIRMRAELSHGFADDRASQWEADLFGAFNGLSEKARLGRIPRFLAKALGSSTTIVFVHQNVVKKIRGKHQIEFSQLREVATAFDSGNVARDSRYDLAFWFPDPTDRRRTVKAVVKTTRQKHELWLKTMHPINKRRVDALKKKSLILRESK